LDDYNDVEYDICFPTIAKKSVIPGETYSYKGPESDSHKLIGWDAAYLSSCEDVAEIKSKADVFEVLSKALFDYVEDGSFVNLNFIIDEDNEHDQIEDIHKLCTYEEYPVSALIKGSNVNKQYYFHNINCHSASDILKKYFLKSSGKKGRNNVIIVIDIGFKRTKLLLLDLKNNNATFSRLRHGFDYYLMKLNGSFLDVNITLHPFVILKELERNNTIIETANGKYDTSIIIKNARYDFNRILVNEIQTILKDFYKSFLVWPGSLYITGGGAILNGDIIRAILSSRFDSFKQTQVETSPRNYLLRRCLEVFPAGADQSDRLSLI
jgi:hypothetical protein